MQCFICYDHKDDLGNFALRTQCKCRNMYVHKSCLNKLLKIQKHNRCAICLIPYRNTRLNKITRPNMNIGVIFFSLYTMAYTLIFSFEKDFPGQKALFPLVLFLKICLAISSIAIFCTILYMICFTSFKFELVDIMYEIEVID